MYAGFDEKLPKLQKSSFFAIKRLTRISFFVTIYS